MGKKDINVDSLSRVLASLGSIGGVAGGMLTDREGNTVTHQLPSDIDTSICESAVATLYGSSEQILDWAKQGDILSVMIEAERGKILISNALDLNLIIITRADVNLGLLRVSLRKVSNQIASIVLGKPVEIEKPVVEIPTPMPEVEAKPPTAKIPEVRPKMEEIPLPAFPEIPKEIEMPTDPARRADLAFDIYKSIFLSLSIGASKVSGVAPARGMLKRYLPLDECAEFLNGVSIQKDATLDFKTLKANADKIPADKREREIKENFGKIITSLVNGYGSVMGYTPLKGMTRKEIKLVTDGYGKAMKKLGILETIPPELR